MGRRDSDLPVCPAARARAVVRAGGQPVYRRVLTVLQELARQRETRWVMVDAGDIVRAVQRRYPGLNRPFIGEVFDAVDFWQAAGRLRWSWNAQGQVVITVRIGSNNSIFER